MDLSNLKWFKFINHPDANQWSYSRKHLETFSGELSKLIIDQNEYGITVFPLGFKQIGKRKPQVGDLMMLAQKGKVTHIVRIVGGDFFETSCEPVKYHRLVEVVWWKPEMDLKNLPSSREIVLPSSDSTTGIKFNLQGQRIFKLPDSSTVLREYWEKHGGVTAFQKHVAQTLQGLGQQK